MALVWLVLLGLAPFVAQPGSATTWSLASGVWDWRHVAAAFWPGVFWLWWLHGTPASHRLSIAAPLGLAMCVLGLSAAQSVYTPAWTVAIGWPGHLVGIACGMLAGTAAAKLRRPVVSEASQRVIWRAVYGICAVLALLTMPPAADPAGWLAALFDHLYQSIKSAILWLPLGGILGLVGFARPARIWTLAGLGTLLLVGHIDLLDLASRDWLDILVVAPSLALGIWLGESTRRAPGWQLAESPVNIAVPATGDEVVPPAGVENLANRSAPALHTGVARGQMEASVATNSHRGDKTAPLRPGVVAGFFGLGAIGLALLALFDFPLLPWILGIGLTLYGGLLWRQPLAWLLVVPAALPVLDLAPWSGRFFLDEFDLLMAVTLAVLILRGGTQIALSWPPLARLVLATFFGLALVSGLIGLDGWPAVDANAFSTYWSPYNSLRVAKGFLWGATLLFLVRRTCVDLERFTRWLAIGMALGLLAVCLVGIWERWLYSGLADRDSSYRIVGLFSSMHTGGGHIEAYMAAALPFLWLGMRHWKSMLLAAPLLALATYVLIYTVARGGALAFGLIFVILAVGSVRLAWLAGNRRVQLAPILVLVGAAAILIGGISGGYFQQRFSQTAEDTQTRLDHWSQTLAMADDSWTTRLFGMGLGSFPRVFLARGVPEERPATYGFIASRTGQALRLGSGATLYYAQRASIEAGTTYRLVLDARAEGGPVRLETPLCEKQMLNSRRCVWSNIDVPGDGAWRRYERAIDSGEVGAGSMFSHLPTEFVLSNAGKAGLLEIDNVRLLDTAGRDLLCNGNFEAGADCWFFKTHSHLPWHIKNVWVHIVFEQGWLGLAAFLALTGLALARAAKAAWRGQPLAWVLLAAMVGMFSVGLFDSLLDAPRLAMLLLGFSLLAVAPPWAARKRSHKRRTAAKRATG